MADGTIYVVGLTVAVVCAFACVSLARSKNRNAVGFFFLGLILGVIGLIIALFVPVRETMHPAHPAGTHGPGG